MKERTEAAIIEAYEKRRRPRTEEHKRKIREGNLRFWAKAKKLFEEQQQQEE